MSYDRYFPGSYATLDHKTIRYIHGRDFYGMREEPEKYGMMFSARIATALYGFPHCSSGRRGPKGVQEVLVAFGDNVQAFVELGFIPCPNCHPERTPNHWDIIGPTVAVLYHLNTLADFANKTKLPFDASRLSWEKIVAMTGGFPSRVYVNSRTIPQDAQRLHERLSNIQKAVPPIGYLDRNSPGGFRVIIPATS